MAPIALTTASKAALAAVTAIVVLGLAWLGVASAFYHAVSGGGAVSPMLPPLMAATRAQKDLPDDPRLNILSQTSTWPPTSEKFVSGWPATIRSRRPLTRAPFGPPFRPRRDFCSSAAVPPPA